MTVKIAIKHVTPPLKLFIQFDTECNVELVPLAKFFNLVDIYNLPRTFSKYQLTPLFLAE